MTQDMNVAAIVNADNREYHEYLGRGELRMQKCTGCGYIRHPQRDVCPECLGVGSVWEKLSGRGTVETFVWYLKNILDRRYTQDWAYQDAPYNVAVVRLAEGPRLLTNVDEVAFGVLKAGDAVDARYVRISDEYAILRFVPVDKTT